MSAHGFNGFFQLRGKWWYGIAEGSEGSGPAMRVLVSARNDKGEYIRMKAPIANWQAACELYVKVILTPQDYQQQYALLDADVMGC